ncbi:glycosyltransferase family 4 protein [Mycobacterium sp. ACS4331]|uniref:glycosyltransferase family 4 protein n=1 Tax=Mycobacterium sp. ACS4331 TaxID=1834121 RepID=UPI000801A8CC|nr:glycosyltransferase family 4 protein [Mycobacterium sp. ACS4331]OBF27946.1 hypothetical protein A5727_02365 [Mycobacterium sp. ACS4331]
MRIVHLLNELCDTGNGIVNVAVDLACAQASAGHEVMVVSGGGAFVSLVEGFGARHHTVRFERTPVALLRAWRAVAALLTEFGPDIVHSHTLTPAVLSYAVRWRDIVARRSVTARLVTTVHNEYQRGAALMGLADATVGVSRAVSTAMARRGIPVSRNRTVHNGTIGTPRRRSAADVAPIDLGPRSVVVLGAVSERKGADVVVAAFATLADEYDDLSLWFVGNPDWADLVAHARTLPCAGRIHFVGLEAEPAKYLNAATVMVLASRRDPFPLVLSEARECGVPIIASDVDGIPEALDGGEAGLLFPVGDSAALAECVRRVVDSDDVRRDLAARAAFGADRLSVQRMTADYVDVYLEQLALRC